MNVLTPHAEFYPSSRLLLSSSKLSTASIELFCFNRRFAKALRCLGTSTFPPFLDDICCKVTRALLTPPSLCPVPLLCARDSSPASNQSAYPHLSFAAETHKKYFSCCYFLAQAFAFISGQDSGVKHCKIQVSNSPFQKLTTSKALEADTVS